MTAWTRTLQSIPRGTNTEVARQRREWIAVLKWSRPAWEQAYAAPAEVEPERELVRA